MWHTAMTGGIGVVLLSFASGGCGRIWYDGLGAGPVPIDSGTQCGDAACNPDAALADARMDAASSDGAVDAAGSDATADGGSQPTLANLCGSGVTLPLRGDAATTAYVDAVAGIDHPTNCTNNGSPCRTIPYAVTNYVAGRDGDRILIRGGQTHAIPTELRLDATYSGAPASPTVLEPWPGTGTPTLDGMGSTPIVMSACCGASAASYLWIEGLVFTGATSRGLELNGTGSVGNVVTQCRFVGNGQGPSPDGLNAGLVLANQAMGNYIVDNVMEANVEPGAGFANGISLDGSNNIIADNTSVSNEVYGIEVFGNNNVILNNRVGSNDDCGIRVRDTSGSLICNNTLWENAGTAIGLENDTNSRLLHNTVVGNTESAVEIATATATASEMRSNILVSSSEFGAVVLPGADEPMDSHNLYFNNSSGPTSGMTRDLPASDILASDPRFVDPPSFDFRLRGDSPARGAGHDGFDMGALPVP